MKTFFLLVFYCVTSFSSSKLAIKDEDYFFQKMEGHWSGENSTVPSSAKVVLIKKPVRFLKDHWVLEGQYSKMESENDLNFHILITKLSIEAASSKPFYSLKLTNMETKEIRRYSLARTINNDSNKAVFITNDGEYYSDKALIFGSSLEFKFEDNELVLSISDSKGYCRIAEKLEYCSSGKGSLYRFKKNRSF